MLSNATESIQSYLVFSLILGMAREIRSQFQTSQNIYSFIFIICRKLRRLIWVRLKKIRLSTSYLKITVETEIRPWSGQVKKIESFHRIFIFDQNTRIARLDFSKITYNRKSIYCDFIISRGKLFLANKKCVTPHRLATNQVPKSLQNAVPQEGNIFTT